MKIPSTLPEGGVGEADVVFGIHIFFEIGKGHYYEITTIFTFFFFHYEFFFYFLTSWIFIPLLRYSLLVTALLCLVTPGDVNDGKCALFIRISVSGGIDSMSQMLRNLTPPRAEPVKRCLPTFSSLLPTVIWVKNCRSKKGIKRCLGGLKCGQNTKKNKKTLKVSFKAIFNVHFANLVSTEYFSIQRLI